jgi:hypothetical protein
VFLFVATAVSLLVSAAVPASATASSGYVYGITTGPYGGVYVDTCVRADIVDVAGNNAYVHSAYNANRCGSPVYFMPSGYLGAVAYGYRSGSYCGNTGWYYNGSATYEFGVGTALCSNPAGSQSFRTVAYGTVWTGSGYSSLISTTSPNQNY